jgi:uncharacterized membrane protein YebE (DUF533 family)
VIRVWAGLVWSDGKMAPEEQDAMRRLILGAELTDDEREVALTYLEHPVDADATGLDALDVPSRIGIYRAAVKLSAVDNDIADEEIDFLGKLREGLGLDDATAEAIEDQVAAGE